MFREYLKKEYREDLKKVIIGDRESYSSYEELMIDAEAGSYSTISYAKADKEITKYVTDVIGLVNRVNEELDIVVKSGEELMGIVASIVSHEIARELSKSEKDKETCDRCGEVIVGGYHQYYLEMICLDCFEKTVDKDDYDEAYELDEAYYSEVEGYEEV